MSIRVDSSSWVSGAIVVGEPGLGVLGSEVPSSGDAGPAPLYNDITLPTDNNVEVRAELLTLPSAGTLTMAEDSSFEWPASGESVPDGTYTATYRVYRDGVPDAGTETITLTMGAAPSTGGVLLSWNGTSFISGQLYRWNGSTWISTPLKRWDGSAWLPV